MASAHYNLGCRLGAPGGLVFEFLGFGLRGVRV